MHGSHASTISDSNNILVAELIMVDGCCDLLLGDLLDGRV